MATIKEVIQQFCYRMNLPAPTAFVGVNSPTEQQYLTFFRTIGDNLRNRPFQWPQLKRGYTFNTQTGVRKYQLPGDFYRILNSSQWDLTNQWPLRGPISDYNFNVREFAVVSLQTRKGFRLLGPTNYLYSTAPYSKRSQGWFEVDPAGQNNTDELFLGYVSCNWTQPRDWVASTVVAAGDIRSGDGYVYVADSGGTTGTTRPNWSTGSASDGLINWSIYHEAYLVEASNTNLNDNDLCLFDTDIMVSGMVWLYLQMKKFEYLQERQDWENQVKSAYSRFNGPTRINMADELGDYYEWPNVPPGSWGV